MCAHSRYSTPLLTSDPFRFFQTSGFSFKQATSRSPANRRKHASKKSHAACPRKGDPNVRQPSHVFARVPGLRRHLYEWLCPGCRSIPPQMGLTAVSLSYRNCIPGLISQGTDAASRPSREKTLTCDVIPAVDATLGANTSICQGNCEIHGEMNCMHAYRKY